MGVGVKNHGHCAVLRVRSRDFRARSKVLIVEASFRLDDPGSWEVVPFWKAILPPTWAEFAFSHPSVREHHFSFALALGLLTPLVKNIGCGRRCRS